MDNPIPAARDPLARFMEWGLMALVILVPLPFGAVGAYGRAGLELAALLLGLLWLARAALHPTRLPGKLALLGMIGLVLVALIQLIPLGEGAVRFLSPGAATIYDRTTAPAEIIDAEQRLIDIDPLSLEKPRTLSVDSGASASALRTGTALCLVFLVATTVAARRGARGMAAALLVSASFQGLYGILIFASGYNKIWHITKVHYLYAATGTFINKNHFACFLAMALACGMALIIGSYSRKRKRATGPLLVRWLSAERSRALLLALLLVIGLAGLLLSMSRAGIALGLGALLVTILIAWKQRSLRARIGITAAVILLAAVPLLQLGPEKLADRYSKSAESWSAEGGRLIVWHDTLAMGAAYPLFGTGYGTFASAYPVYRAPEVRKFYKHAHNDYIQAFAEGGMAGAAFTVMLLVAVLISIASALKGDRGSLAVGLAAALAIFMLHSLIDFNLHIPANAAIAALLAGALQGLPCKNGSCS